MRQMPFRGDYKPPKTDPKIDPPQPSKPEPSRGNPKSFQTRNYRAGKQQNPWRQYGSNPTHSSQSNPTRNATSQRRNPNSHQPQINAPLAQIQSDVEQNPYSDPSLLSNLRDLASMMPNTNTDPDNTDTGHHPR